MLLNFHLKLFKTANIANFRHLFGNIFEMWLHGRIKITKKTERCKRCTNANMFMFRELISILNTLEIECVTFLVLSNQSNDCAHLPCTTKLNVRAIYTDSYQKWEHVECVFLSLSHHLHHSYRNEKFPLLPFTLKSKSSVQTHSKMKHNKDTTSNLTELRVARLSRLISLETRKCSSIFVQLLIYPTLHS